MVSHGHNLHWLNGDVDAGLSGNCPRLYLSKHHRPKELLMNLTDISTDIERDFGSKGGESRNSDFGETQEVFEPH